MMYLLQAAGQQPPGGGYMMFVIFGGILLVMYFMVWRPQQKQRKKQKQFIESMKRGDQVVSIGGIHGKVFEVKDDIVTLEIADGVKIKMDKSSIRVPNANDKK